MVALLVRMSGPSHRAHAHRPVVRGPALGIGGLAGAAGHGAGVAAVELHALLVKRTVEIVLAFAGTD